MPKCVLKKIEITLRYGCSPVNLLNIFRTPFRKNTSHLLNERRSKFKIGKSSRRATYYFTETSLHRIPKNHNTLNINP